MDPVTVGLMVASLVAKEALEAAADSAGKAGWDLLGRLSSRVRSWFTDEGDEEALSALDAVVENPESKGHALVLAEALQARLPDKPNIALELQRLLEEVESSTDEKMRAFAVNVRESARVGELAVVSGSVAKNLVAGDQSISAESGGVAGGTIEGGIQVNVPPPGPGPARS